MNILTILITGSAFRWSYFIIGGGGVLLLIILGCYAAYVLIPGFINPSSRAHDEVVKTGAAPETNDYNKPDTPKGTKDRVKRGERIDLQYLN